MSNDKSPLVETHVNQTIRDDVRSMNAYHIPSSDGMIKLDAMENPYSWDSELINAWQARAKNIALNRYPDPQSKDVKIQLAKMMGVDAQYDILLGNGSDEIIQMLMMAVASDELSVCSFEPSFVMYKMIAQFLRLSYAGVTLNSDFSIDLDATLASLNTQSLSLVFIAQPNNPTGNLFDLADIKKIIEATNGLVVVDEAYTAFTDFNSIELLDQYPNVVVMRTLSKVGLAGLRLGMLIGHPAWIEQIDKVRLPYNIGSLTQLSAEFALENFSVFQKQTEAIRASRETLFDALSKIAGVKVFPSEANFLLIKILERSANDVFAALKSKGVLVKNLHGHHAHLADCLRVTVGAEAENTQFLSALQSILST